MDQALIELLKNTPLPVILAAALIYIAKRYDQSKTDAQSQLVGLINRYHDLTIELVKQLTILAEEVKRDPRE